MTCKEVQRKLKQHIKGELEGAASKELLEHLEFCKECLEKEEFLRSDGKIFLEAKEFEAPEGLFERVIEGVGGRPPREAPPGIRSIFRAFNRPVRLSTAASFIVVFILGLVLGAWGISISNRMLIKENANLVKLVNYIQSARQVNPTAAAASQPRIEARIFDKENNLIAVQPVDSLDDLLKLIEARERFSNPGPTSPAREEGPPDAGAKVVRYE